MELLQLLGTALGMGALAGINLYLTVFATGLAIQQGWIVLAPQYHGLAALGDPSIVIIAGLLYFIQFFADKIPWVDSLWDAVHTVIRPLGAAFVASKVLGHADPVFDVVIVLLAGGVGLTTHSLKAGTRLIANGSPEPFSNIALSITEDASVIGGLFLVHTHPIVTLFVVIGISAFVVYVGPKLLRAFKVKLWLVWKKVNSGPESKNPVDQLPKRLAADTDILLHALDGAHKNVEWAVECITGGGCKRLGSNVSGYLVAIEGEPERLHFVSKSRWIKRSETMELGQYKVDHQSKFLSENIVLYSVDGRPKRTFVFDRSQAGVVTSVAEAIRSRLLQPA